MSDDWDPESICRDDDCERTGVHLKHPILSRGRPIRVHHRPSSKAVQLPPESPRASKKPPWKRDDPKSLTGAVARATSRSWPTHFSAIVRDVQDDYGHCCERTVYRHVAKLVERGHLLKLDVGLPFAAYIRPKSRLLRDLDTIRDHLMALVELGPPTTKRARKAKQAEPAAPEARPELATPAKALIIRCAGGAGVAEHKRVRALGTRAPTPTKSNSFDPDKNSTPIFHASSLDDFADVVA